nr:MAG TPA: hypothetical protein [Caudoviricetes sp.]
MLIFCFPFSEYSLMCLIFLLSNILLRVYYK